MVAAESNKCTGTTAGSGYAGTFISTKPTECSSATTSDNTKDPSTGVTDDKIKAMMTKVVTGVMTVADLQKALTDAGVTDILITAIVPPYSDNGKMVFRVQITITSTKTTDQAKQNLNDAVVKYFGVDSTTQIATTDLLAQSAKKRAGSNSYLQTTTIQSAPPPQPGPQPTTTGSTDNLTGAGSNITPLWLCTLLIALLFLR